MCVLVGVCVVVWLCVGGMRVSKVEWEDIAEDLHK